MHRMKGQHRTKPGGGVADMDFNDQYEFSELPGDADVSMPDGEHAEKVVPDPNFFNSFGDLFDDEVMVA
eukprot:CAMPEP_0181326516 /NCGR_PEP_ID=MMETSP1101-20121128/21546_1 /TAXON_ID=46948 /ORGANISM="Rhodomonas abbreviata, Strain Caron Lab Isolate" /LENGTH=68 /DNA_ID=CAMNT_0023434987 /DNA_START=142 /DNA_END=348 /DNA_ORIENTATION=-